jgi:hypothetical protein
VLVLLVVLHGVLLLMLLHVQVLVGGRMMLFQVGDNERMLVGPLVLSLVMLLAVWQLHILFRGHVLLLFMVGGGLQMGVLLLLLMVVVPLMLVVGVLHVEFLRLLVPVFGRLLLHILANIEMLLVGQLVALLFEL